MSSLADLQKSLRDSRFDLASAIAETLLREAAAESAERLTEAARGIVAWRGFFANAAEAAASEPYFRAVARALEMLAGPESPAAMAATENLAGILGSLDQLEEAITLREKVYAHVLARFPKDDPRLMSVRDGLGFLYQRAGRDADRDALYRDCGLCEHLAPVEGYLRLHGAKIVSCCRPWSENCHIWLYFDCILDGARLIEDLGLPGCVRIHDHHGTHDGSESGLVCTVDHDGVLGPHPSEARPGTRILPVR